MNFSKDFLNLFSLQPIGIETKTPSITATSNPSNIPANVAKQPEAVFGLPYGQGLPKTLSKTQMDKALKLETDLINAGIPRRLATNSALEQIQNPMRMNFVKKSFLTNKAEKDRITILNKFATEEQTDFVLSFVGGGMENKIQKETQDIITKYLSSKVSTIIEKNPLGTKERFYSSLNRFHTAIIDRFNPITKITEMGERVISKSPVLQYNQAVKEVTKILPGENPSNLARRFLGTKGIAESKLFWNTTELTPEGNVKINGPGLSKILEPVKNNLDDIRALMTAQRDIELSKRMTTIKTGSNISEDMFTSEGWNMNYKKQLLDDIKNLGGVKIPQGYKEELMNFPKNIISKTGQTPDEIIAELNGRGYFFNSGDELIDEINKLNIVETKGKAPTITTQVPEISWTTPEESQKAINALKQKHGSNFQMLEKITQDLRDFANRTVINPLKEVGALSEDAYNAIINSNKFYTPYNRVIEEVSEKGYLPKNINIFAEKQKPLPIKEISGGPQKIIDPLESLITNTYKTTAFVEKERVAKSIVNFRKLGPEMEEMITPVKGLGKNTITTFEDGKRVYYQVSPELSKAVSEMTGGDMNIITKILSFPTKLKRTGATLTPEFIGRNPLRDQFSAFIYSKYGYTPGVDLIQGIWETVGKTDLYNRWMASGGAQSMFVSLDRNAAQKTLQNVMGKKIVSYNPIEALQALSEWGEKGTRVGSFAKAIKKGATDIQAAVESREITLDFGRIGSQSKAVNQVIAFWNANVQGMDKLVRSMMERPIQTSFKAVVGITLPTVGLYLLNKDNPLYLELPQWRKDLCWNIIIPNPTGKDSKIPAPVPGGFVTVGKEGIILSIVRPFELGQIFGTVPEHILTWINKNDPEALSTIPRSIITGGAPGFIPDIMGPLIENRMNYSFFRDRPIVSQNVQDLPVEMQANTYTSETAKEIGKLIKESPAKIDNLVTGYFAGLGNYVLDASDFILKKLGVTNPPNPPTQGLEAVPFIRGFVSKEPMGTGSESVNKFYKMYDKATKAYNGTKEIGEKENVDAAAEYMKNNKEAFFYKAFTRIALTLSKIRQQKDTIYNSRDITSDQKRVAINELDRLMTEIAKQALIVVNENK